MDGEGVAHGMRADRLANARKPPGARQENEVTSCRRLPLRAPFKEVLESPTALVTTNREDFVRAGNTPVHGGVFEASGEDHFAAGLDDVAGGAQFHGESGCKVIYTTRL